MTSRAVRFVIRGSPPKLKIRGPQMYISICLTAEYRKERKSLTGVRIDVRETKRQELLIVPPQTEYQIMPEERVL